MCWYGSPHSTFTPGWESNIWSVTCTWIQQGTWCAGVNLPMHACMRSLVGESTTVLRAPPKRRVAGVQTWLVLH